MARLHDLPETGFRHPAQRVCAAQTAQDGEHVGVGLAERMEQGQQLAEPGFEFFLLRGGEKVLIAVGERGILAGGFFARNEVATHGAANLVVLDHRQFFRHVEGEVVVGAGATASFSEVSEKVLVLNETVFFNPVFDPRCEVVAVFKASV